MGELRIVDYTTEETTAGRLEIGTVYPTRPWYPQPVPMPDGPKPVYDPEKWKRFMTNTPLKQVGHEEWLERKIVKRAVELAYLVLHEFSENDGEIPIIMMCDLAKEIVLISQIASEKD